MKYIIIWYYYVKEFIEKRNIKIKYIPVIKINYQCYNKANQQGKVLSIY